MIEELIHIKNLEVGFPKQSPLLSGINLSVNRGEIIVLLGDNGSGKSTLLRSMCGLLKLQGGDVLLEKQSIREWNAHELAKRIAFVSSIRLNNQMIKVDEFVTFGRYPYLGNLLRLTEKDEIIVEQNMQYCGISHLAGKQLGEISDGEKQKVALARAFAQETEILLLDEPTTHLDIKNTRAIFNLLQQSKKKSAKSVLFSSHQVEKALKIADKVWLVANKKIDCFEVNDFLKSEAYRDLIAES